MKTCAFCHAEAKDENERFCRLCGHRFETMEESKPVAVESAPDEPQERKPRAAGPAREEDTLPRECPKCGARYIGGTRFCAKDGANLMHRTSKHGVRVCRVCGTQHDRETSYCTVCSASLKHPPTIVYGDMELVAKAARERFVSKIAPGKMKMWKQEVDRHQPLPLVICRLTLCVTLACYLILKALLGIAFDIRIHQVRNFLYYCFYDSGAKLFAILSVSLSLAHILGYCLRRRRNLKELVGVYNAYLNHFDGGVRMASEMRKQSGYETESKIKLVNIAMLEYSHAKRIPGTTIAKEL